MLHYICFSSKLLEMNKYPSKIKEYRLLVLLLGHFRIIGRHVSLTRAHFSEKDKKTLRCLLWKDIEDTISL